MIPVIGFLGGRTGTGTTTFVYHLAWLYAEQGYRVLVADLDPQPNLSVRMLDEERLMKLWAHLPPAADADPSDRELLDLVREPIAPNLELLVGDPALVMEEDLLARSWQTCHTGSPLAFHETFSVQRRVHAAARAAQADVVLIDLASMPSALNRAALLACQFMIALVAPDLLSIHELIAWLPRIEEWRADWADMRATHEVARQGPEALATSAGYIVREQPVRVGRSSLDWSTTIATAYAHASRRAEDEVDHLGTLKWYGSVLPMAEEARKPLFHLKPADGALGAHAKVVREFRNNFERIAQRIADTTWKRDDPARAR
ncbi:MAG TPA: AAA family ATPase [Kofleriaceae bacterium]|nr:AAA family ATPase [Kofleriaceae bacterium]